MDKEQYRKHAKDLVGPTVQLCEQVLIKHTTAVLEEMHDQLKERDEKINKLEETLGTAIMWLQNQFGNNGVKMLLEKLEIPQNVQEATTTK